MPSIRLYEPFDFPNILPEIRLTYTDIEQQVSNIIYKRSYHEPKPHNEDKAEAKYPIEMVPVFYRFVIREQRIPTQDEFLAEARTEMQMSGFDLDGQEDEYKNGLITRLKDRTYPSLIRDVHFCKLLEAYWTGPFTVLYNPALDLLGIDILLIPNNTGMPIFGICLYLDTQEGNRGLERKKLYRKSYWGVRYIDMPKSLPEKVEKDRIWLYGSSDVDRLRHLIEQSIALR